jgi:hypothetical protein
VLGVRLRVSRRRRAARAASRAGSCTRRRFFGAAGALAAALWVGCGRDEARERPPSDAEVLSGLLERERQTLAAVTGVAGAAAIVRQDRQHVARLSALAGPAASGHASGPAGAKQEALFAYVEALPRLSDPDLRVLVMQIAASEAEHLSALRLAAGEEPVPDAFAGYTVKDGS